MNKVILVGRLTADPELRQTQNGTASCKFTVAVNRNFKNQNGEYEADFISCMAWKQNAEFVSRYFRKGQMICVEGSLRTGSYQDRNHQDVTHYTTDVLVEHTEFCGSKNDNQNNNQGGYQNQGNYSPAPQQQYQQQNYQNQNYQQPNQNYQQNYQQSYQQPNQYQNQGGYQQQGMNYGTGASDFEEILSDGDVPF